MKKSLVTVYAIAACLLFSACGAKPAPAETAPPSTPPAATPEAAIPAEGAPEIPAPPAAERALPFTDADVTDISAGLETVADYVALLQPNEYSWEYQEATGTLFLMLVSKDEKGEQLGYAILGVYDESGALASMADGEAITLAPELLTMPAWLSGACWQQQAYALPPVRGIGPGSMGQEVVNAFFSHHATEPQYTAKDMNPLVDDTWEIDEYYTTGAEAIRSAGGAAVYCYGWCTLEEPVQWREYYTLEYILQDDVVTLILLSYDADAE